MLVIGYSICIFDLFAVLWRHLSETTGSRAFHDRLALPLPGGDLAAVDDEVGTGPVRVVVELAVVDAHDGVGVPSYSDVLLLFVNKLVPQPPVGGLGVATEDGNLVLFLVLLGNAEQLHLLLWVHGEAVVLLLMVACGGPLVE